MNPTAAATSYFSQASNPETGAQTQTQTGRARGRTGKALWTGRILSGIAVLFLTGDAVTKIVARASEPRTRLARELDA
jgi:hypothetical protein